MPDADATKLTNLDELTGSLAFRVYTAMKSAILSLEFPPGAVIRKAAICDQLGLSRSPVSEALAKLSSEGLVDIIPQSVTRVSRLSMSAIREDAFLREALEVAAARHAALHRSDETLARLQRNIEMQKLLIVDVDKDDFIKTDVTFHETIMSTTRISRLAPTVEFVSQHLFRARLLMLPDEPVRLSETLKEHIGIFEAIGARDEQAAQEAMREHVRQLLKRLEPLETARPDIFST